MRSAVSVAFPVFFNEAMLERIDDRAELTGVAHLSQPTLLHDRAGPPVGGERLGEHVLALHARDRSRAHQRHEFGEHLGRELGGRRPRLVEVGQHLLAHPVHDVAGRARITHGDDGPLGVVGQAGYVDEYSGVLLLDSPVGGESGTADRRVLGQRRAQLFDPRARRRAIRGAATPPPVRNDGDAYAALSQAAKQQTR